MSASACCEQHFGQEEGTNSPVTETASLPLENVSHLPEVTLNYESVSANFKTLIKSLVIVLDISLSLILLKMTSTH